MFTTLLNIRLACALFTALALTIPSISTAKPTTAEKDVKDIKVYIVHGYKAKPADHWFTWLKTELAKKDVKVEIITMPNSDNPEASTWQEALNKNIDRLDEHTYLVAHSLGCISVLRYLADNQLDFKLGGLFLVSGFNSTLPALPQLDSFIENTAITEPLSRQIKHTLVFASTKDPFVPILKTKNLSDTLEAKLIQIENAGHFLADDGYSEFPELLNELLSGMGV